MLAKLVGRLDVTARGRINPVPAPEPPYRDETSGVPVGSWAPVGVAVATVRVAVTETLGEADADGEEVPTAVTPTVVVPATVPAAVDVDLANDVVVVPGGVSVEPGDVVAVSWAEALGVVPIESVGAGAFTGTDVGGSDAPSDAWVVVGRTVEGSGDATGVVAVGVAIPWPETPDTPGPNPRAPTITSDAAMRRPAH